MLHHSFSCTRIIRTLDWIEAAASIDDTHFLLILQHFHVQLPFRFAFFALLFRFVLKYIKLKQLLVSATDFKFMYASYRKHWIMWNAMKYKKQILNFQPNFYLLFLLFFWTFLKWKTFHFTKTVDILFVFIVICGLQK